MCSEFVLCDSATNVDILDILRPIHSFNHSGYFYSASLSPQHGYCVGVSSRSATGNREWRTCPTCRLDWDSNPQAFARMRVIYQWDTTPHIRHRSLEKSSVKIYLIYLTFYRWFFFFQDKYILGSMAILCCICVWHAVIPFIMSTHSLTSALTADTVALVVLSLTYIGLHVVFILSIVTMVSPVVWRPVLWRPKPIVACSVNESN